MEDLIKIGNCSGFYGDKLSAAKEMVEGGPIDVLTGDYLAELTMAILFSQKMQRGEQAGFGCDGNTTLYIRASPTQASATPESWRLASSPL